MCGIAGVYSSVEKGVSPKILERMTKSLSHRGPDDSGVVLIDWRWEGKYKQNINGDVQRDEDIEPIEVRCTQSVEHSNRRLTSYHKVGLGHTRLSIIDLSKNAHQPMCSNDRSLWITYNGEIYNYKELQNNLRSKGYDFKSNSDTEVIIAAYQHWGISCLERLNGMFAFALWDGKQKILFLARDRFGVKPLYYYYHNQEGFCFASETKAILMNESYAKEIDLNSLYNYIGLLYVPGDDTIWKGIKSVPPGCYLKLENGNVTTHRYWCIKPNWIISPKQRRNSWVEGIKKRLEKAVGSRMISDVPIGSFLSGGVDSSCITLLMTQLTNQRVKTFSLGFKEDDSQILNELPYAKRVAQHLDTEHYEFVITYKDILNELPNAIRCFDEPYAGSLPQYFLSKLAREHVTVCLGGLGGDEIFGSYGRFFSFKKIFEDRFLLNWLLPEEIKKLVNRKSLGYYFFNRFCIFSEEEKVELISKDVLSKVNQEKKFINKLDNLFKRPLSNPLDVCCIVDIATQLEGEYLKYMDRLSMAFALEMREPFLDHEFVEFVFSIPPDTRVKENNLKYLLSQAFGHKLPAEVFNRKKGGFSLPYTSWINKELKPYVMEYLSPSAIKNRGILNPNFVAHILEKHYSGAKDYTYKIWSLFILELWYRLYIDNDDITFLL